jgi:transposase InsO family protein
LTRNKIKILRLDNGGEYMSKGFYDFCIKAGIKREYIVPYKPQYNGIAERNNMSIVEATKAMTHDQIFPMFMWEEESMTIVYVQNMLPHNILNNMTPMEAFMQSEA